MTESILNRFYSKAERDPETDCWNWTSAIGTRGYGVFWIGGKKRNAFAHRFSWELHNFKTIPQGMYVMHSCDNPRCVNPGHLSLGSPLDNARDAVRKGRHAHGERNLGGGKLTAEKARRIRERADGLSITKTAALYGVSTNTVKRIRAGRLWANA